MVYIETKKLFTANNAMIDITEPVVESLKKSGVKNGIITVETPHTTAGIIKTVGGIKEVEQDVIHEIKKLIPSRITFKHEESPDDAAGHIKCALFGNSVTYIVKDGEPIDGGKLHCFFMDYDGPRERSYSVCVVGE